MPTPGLGRRLLCLIYEALLLTAVVLFSVAIATGIARLLDIPHPRLLTQIVLLLVCGCYFVLQWMRSGQTLPMKTWRMRIETRDGRPLDAAASLRRLILAMLGYGSAGITILWALFDRDRQFLHDRLAGTRLVTLTAGEPEAGKRN
ncbi:MAG: RDD family protein [Burkholderiales bacterium]|nr:RDD family protein [Burkholderiales bacterium]